MRVLVADDDIGARLVAQAVVEGLGHECMVASDGHSAWRLFGTYQPEILVTDWQMPGLDGLQLCRAIREAERDSYTYIVLVTSLARRADILAGMRAGADDYLVKPLDQLGLEACFLAARRVTSLHAELGLHRVALVDQARTDSLTGLYNRRKMSEHLKVLASLSQRYGRDYALAMCDVDAFKAYNDAYGHQAGDAALRAVAASLTEHAREGDGIYRYGGEEFLIILPEQDAATAATAVERLRAAVQRQGITHPAGPAGVVTISAGISASVQDNRVDQAELLKQADAALYWAKSHGRNRVHIALV